MKMKVEQLIAGRLRFGGALATAAVAVSFFIIIVSVSISSGFRVQIRSGLSRLSGDIQVGVGPQTEFSDLDFFLIGEPWVDSVKMLKGVKKVTPAIYKAGIAKSGDDIQGIIVKGIPSEDTTALGISIPRTLSKSLRLSEGDRMLTYFVGEKVKARNFNVVEVYDAMSESQDKIVVLAHIEDLQRLNAWEEDQVSCVEIEVDPKQTSRESLQGLTNRVSLMSGMMATNIYERYPALFDWLRLIDTNVIAILLLMIAVAGFNMISGLLIMLFRSTSTIGTLKALGMTDRMVASVFLRIGARVVLVGMAIGNIVAFAFCAVQSSLHLVKLDAASYFLPFVPVHLDIAQVLLFDVIAFAAIEILLVVPCLFIAKVDPATSLKRN